MLIEDDVAQSRQEGKGLLCTDYGAVDSPFIHLERISADGTYAVDNKKPTARANQSFPVLRCRIRIPWTFRGG